jgi:hypothetical protein
MCPACVATMALMLGSATATGGLTAFIVKKLRSKPGAEKISLAQMKGEFANGKEHD